MTETNDDLLNPHHRPGRLIRFHAMLSRINRAIMRAEDPYELYKNICRIAIESGMFRLSWVGLIKPDVGCLQQVAQSGATIKLDQALLKQTMSPEWATCPVIAAIAEGRPDFVNDITTVAVPWFRLLEEAGLKSVAVLPLKLDESVIGVMLMASEYADYFNDDSVVLLKELTEDISYALGMSQREVQRDASENRIQHLAYYDEKTGLPGRQIFIERLADISQASGCSDIAVMVVCLRRYHGALQILGQDFGAELAHNVVSRLQSLLPTVPVARISESEFAFIIENRQGLHQVEETAWQIHAALSKAIPTGEKEVILDPFVGIAMYPRDGHPSEVLKAAQLAAKADPKDTSSFCRFYVANMDNVSRPKVDVEMHLRGALERQEFVLHFQPQVDMKTGAIVGAEALVRWQRPGGGLTPPKEFIPLLEKSGLIVPVGKWILQEACRQAKQWQDEGLKPIRVAVNLSARQFEELDLCATIRKVLEETGLEPHWLELELTESIVLLNADAVIRVLNELKACGVSHSLDDFGTGYSSLSYLQRLPVARVKIDRSFVANITNEPSDAAIVRAIVGMAHSLGLAATAEGVETEGQLFFLQGLCCDEAQGFYFSQAVAAEQFQWLLREAPYSVPNLRGNQTEKVLLLVDDEASVLSSLRRLLRRTDYKILSTTSTAEAFELLATNPVNVVVCDQRMPDMTGTEFLRRVKELHPAVVRIILSGYTELNSVIDSFNRGAVFKFLTKPWEDDMIIDCLQEAFRFYYLEASNRALRQKVEELMAVEGGSSSSV